MAAPLPSPRLGLSRERILAESARVFNRRGFHGTALGEVARTLGVSKAALYYHVPSKEDLLFECYRAAIEIGLEGIRWARERCQSPEEQLRLALGHYIEHIADQLRGSVVLVEEGVLSPERQRQVIAWRDEFERALREIIARGVAEGAFVPCDPKLVGFAILGAMNWIPKWYDPAGTRTGKEIAEAFASYLVRGLQRRPAAGAVGPAAPPAATP